VKPIRLQRKETFGIRIFIVFHADNYILIKIYIVNDHTDGSRQARFR
jgi:hypothetical protein